MIAQLPLALRWPRRQRFEFFHPGANAAALAAVQTLTTEMGAPWVYLQGVIGSGRSHLLMAACQAANALGQRVQYLPLAGLSDPVAALQGISGSQLLALDDVQAVAGQRETEHALFALYNRTRDEGGAMLFAADVAPAHLELVLPDLRSRLGACTQFTLRLLDEDERRKVLKAQASSRGLDLDEPVLDWLFARYTRDLGALLSLFERLDLAALAAKRRITVPFLREFLRESKSADAGHS